MPRIIYRGNIYWGVEWRVGVKVGCVEVGDSVIVSDGVTVGPGVIVMVGVTNVGVGSAVGDRKGEGVTVGVNHGVCGAESKTSLIVLIV